MALPMKSDSSRGCSAQTFHTTFILDNSVKMHQRAPDPFDLDLLNRGKSELGPSTGKTSETWMTWAIESCMEYCRIAWDILPDHPIAVYATDSLDFIPIMPVVSLGNPCVENPKLKSLRVRMMNIARHGPSSQPLSSESVENCFYQLRILECQTLLSAPFITEPLEICASDRPFFLRIVLITAEENEERILQMIRNAMLKKKIAYLARYEVTVVCVEFQSSGGKSLHSKLTGVPEGTTVHLYKAGKGTDVLEALKDTITWDMRLSRTVITDIPMKEDAKSGASTSFSFDVELFHPTLMDESRKPRPAGEVLRMKWVKPIRGPLPGWTPMDHTVPVRASASEPTTRPTQCLVGYVVDGNAIFVESKSPAVAGKLFLCGGKICFQQLVAGTDRVVEDFPALAELPGGRVGNYRVKDLAALLSLCPIDLKALPVPAASRESQTKLTSYFPLVYNESIVFMLPQLMPFFEVFNLVTVPEEGWGAARQALEEVVGMEKAGAAPPNVVHLLPSNLSTVQKKAETYAMFYAELDLILEANAERSAKYNKLWTFYRGLLRKPVREDLREVLKSRALARTYKAAAKPVTNPTTQSTSSVNEKKRKPARPEFEGRLKYGRYAKLYQNVQKSDKPDTGLIHASLEL